MRNMPKNLFNSIKKSGNNIIVVSILKQKITMINIIKLTSLIKIDIKKPRLYLTEIFILATQKYQLLQNI